MQNVSPPPTVLVTGGSRGIGRAICLAFGQAGWRVGIHYRERRKEAESTAAAIKECGGEAVCFQADIRDVGQVAAMVERVVDLWGKLHVMICNAGISSSRLLLRLNSDAWLTVLDTNLTGTFHCLKAAGAQMLSQEEGSIIVIGSFAGIQGRTGQSAYAASKAGLLGLVRTAAREWGSRNVRVNVVLPGWHKTEMSESVLSDSGSYDDHALGRPPQLTAVARSIYHLALLEDASGQVWNLDSRTW